MKTSIFMPIPS